MSESDRRAGSAKAFNNVFKLKSTTGSVAERAMPDVLLEPESIDRA
ncbi:MAG: hypothetical protein AAF353_15975 [Pseudomonadota bacterium]